MFVFLRDLREEIGPARMAAPPSHRSCSSTRDNTLQAAGGVNLRCDLPTLQQHMRDDERIHQQRDVALHDAIHSFVRTQQKKLLSSHARCEQAEAQNAVLIDERHELTQQLKECEVKLRDALHQRQADSACREEFARLRDRLSAQEAALREAERSVAAREAAVASQESELQLRVTAFDASLEPRKADINADAVHVQEMKLQAQQLMEEASRVAEAASAKRLDAERVKRSCDEAAALHTTELLHRQRLLHEALSEREAHVEQRLSACSMLEARLRQWASDINTEVAGHARIRDEQLDHREQALSDRHAQLSVREQRLAEAEHKLEIDRQELLHVLQEGMTGVESGSVSDGDARLRLLQRLRRIRTLLGDAGGRYRGEGPIDAQSATYTPNSSRASGSGTDVHSSSHQDVSARREHAPWPPVVVDAQRLEQRSSASSSLVVSRASSMSTLNRRDAFDEKPDPRAMRAKHFSFRYPTAAGESPLMMDVDRLPAAPPPEATGQVVESPPFYFSEGAPQQRLQRSPPTRRVITSPLKLKETKGTLQEPLS